MRFQLSPTAKYQTPAMITCHECGAAMVVATVVPVIFMYGYDEITYTCQNCGNDIHQTVKRKLQA